MEFLAARWRLGSLAAFGRFLPAREGLAHFRLRLDAQRIRDTVDVIEIRDDFHRVQDIAIAQTVQPQRLDILLTRGGGRARDVLGEFGQRLLARREPGAQVVVLDVLGERGVLGFLTEILSVRFDSIETMVGPGSDRPQQFALGAREAGRRVHRRQIQFH